MSCKGSSVRFQGTSFCEQTLIYYISQQTPAEGQFPIGRKRLDVYLRDHKTAIEYDGFRYHQEEKQKQRDREKADECQRRGIRLIRVREGSGERRVEGDVVTLNQHYNNADFSFMVNSVLRLLGLKDADVNIKRDSAAILQQYAKVLEEGSLAACHPDIAAEWDYERNGLLRPDMVSRGSRMTVYWRCSEGHSWPAVISQRTVRRCGCPYCSGRMCLTGVNDLQTRRPDVAAEWHPTLNGSLRPTEVAFTSGQRAWFQCSECGHEWQTIVANRGAGRGCPVCGRKKRDRAMTDGFVRHFGSCLDGQPLLQREWAADLNRGIDPTKINRSSRLKVYWRCSECGHEWQAEIRNRVQQGKGCPVCGRRKTAEANLEKALQQTGSIADRRPDLMREWDYEANVGIDPSRVPLFSQMEVHWRCSKCGGTFTGRVASRVRSPNSPCYRHKKD